MRALRSGAMPLSALISAWLLGTLGSVHCLAMCGGFVAAAAARDAVPGGAGPAVLLPAATIARRQLAYHAGRLSTYAMLGAAFGAAGSTALDATFLLSLQRPLYVGANIFLLLLGLSVALGMPRMPGLQRLGANVFGALLPALLPALRPLLAHPGTAGRLVLGLVWGLVPCTLVYAVLPLALFAGGAWQGAAVMFAFGTGTVPMLAAAGLALRVPLRIPGLRGWRFVAAAAVIAFSIAGMYRSLFVAGALAQGPFCLIG